MNIYNTMKNDFENMIYNTMINEFCEYFYI